MRIPIFNVNKRRMNINITAVCGLPEGINAVFNGRKFDQSIKSPDIYKLH